MIKNNCNNNSVEEILERTRQRKVRLDNDLYQPSPQSQSIKRKSSADSAASSTENATHADPPVKRSSFNDKHGEVDSLKRRTLYPTQELNDLKESADPNDVITLHTPSQYARKPIGESSTPFTFESTKPSSTRKERFQALAAHIDEFEVDMKHYTPNKAVTDVVKVNSPHSSPSTKVQCKRMPVDVVVSQVDEMIVQVSEKMSPCAKDKDIIDQVCTYARTAIQGASDNGIPAPPPLPQSVNIPEPSGKVSSLATSWETRIGQERTIHTEVNPIDPAQMGARKAFFEVAAARATHTASQSSSQSKLSPAPVPVQSTPVIKPMAGSNAQFEVKPASRAQAPIPTVSSGLHWKPTAMTERVSPKKEVFVAKKMDMGALRNRWEVSSSTGTPLHPDADADDLTKAAIAMAVSAKRTPIQPTPTVNKQPSKSTGCQIEINDLPVEEEVEEEYVTGEEEIDDEVVNECGDSEHDSTSDSVFGAVIDECLDQMLSSESADSSVELQFQAEQRELTPVCATAPVMHSVSFYRTMQKASRTPGKDATLIIRPPTSPSRSNQNTNSSPDKRQRREIQIANEKKQAALKEAVNVQQEQIAQASRALNLCRTTAEFRGSREEVDAQRALLLATERRRALLRESDRITQCLNRKHAMESEGPHGTMTISAITTQLKREFVNDNINRVAGDLLFYFICLFKHRENVICTQMVTSDDGLKSGKLEFPNYLQLNNLPNDFLVKLEIYSLRTKREAIAHDEKYRINGNTLKSKTKSSHSSLFSPGVSSPGGPVAVLDPSFQMLGSLDITLASVSQAKFRMEGVQFSAPIEGTVSVKLRCCADDAGVVTQEGFLSLYEEISGYGSWTRLWCTLKEGQMKFWRYPDEEQTKEPLALVDLSRSLTTVVEAMGRDKCIRPHTFKVDVAPGGALLVPSTKKKQQYVRYMLSSDTKDDCNVWCSKVNATLRNVRMWNPDCISE